MADVPRPDSQQLAAAITALEAQRALLGDAVVDAAVGPMREQLARQQAVAPQAAAQAVRLVTVLFTDIVGSTRVAARVDAEDMLELSSHALARLAAIVETHRGRVLRFTGDGLKAVFGADAVREDDAERAVSCALAMQAEAGLLAAVWAQRGPGFDFSIRVGIHSGAVALGGGVEGGATMMGSAVNLAARLEQAAPAGAVRISHETFNLVRGLFELDRQDPLMLKGVADPVDTYLVRSAKPRASRVNQRGIDGLSTRMVGREAELQVLQQAFSRLFTERRQEAIAIVAEAGIGKSRLLREFGHWRQSLSPAQSVHRFEARATPQTEGQPFGLLRDLITRLFGITDDDSLDAARERLVQGVVPLFVDSDGADLAEGNAHLLGHLIGIDWRDSRHLKGILDDPLQIRNRAQHTAAQVMRRICARDGVPAILELDDLHWADSDSLEFLRHLVGVNRDVPMLVLGLSRSTLFERRLPGGSAEGMFSRIDLRPLEPSASRSLADELLRRLPSIPVLLRDLITGGSDGNPFYMEELVKMLIDQRAICVGADSAWSVDLDRLLATAVPTTLSGVLQARLDGLPAPERLALQEASVIGPVFWDRALLALDGQAAQLLPALVRRELAQPRDAVAAGIDADQREYAFSHQMLHQVTYATVLKRSKRELHRRLADWLAALGGLRGNDLLGVIADHYSAAGAESDAAEYHTRAAEYARTLYAHDAVLARVERAFAALDKTAAVDEHRLLRWRLLDARERTLDVQGDRIGQQRDIVAMAQLADALSDTARSAHVAYRRGVLALRTADWPACEQAGRRAMALAEAAAQDELRLLSKRLLALAITKQGDSESGQLLIEAALHEARSLGFRTVESFCLNALAVIASLRNDPVTVLDCARQDLAINRDTANRRGEAVALSSVGIGLMELGRHADAEAALRESLRLLRANGDRVIEGATLCSLSTISLRRGEIDTAIEMARLAADTALAVQSRDRQAIALCKLGNAECARADLSAAEAAYRCARELATGLGEPVRHDAAAGLASVLSQQGRTADSLEALDELLADGGQTLDSAEDPRLIEWRCHQVLAAAGDVRSDAWRRRARSNLQATADSISDAGLRRSFLDDISTHHDIVSAAGG